MYQTTSTESSIIFMFLESKSLGNKIKAIRNQHRLSGWRFAQVLGVSIDTLRSWEIGRNRPDAENLLKLADLAPPGLTWEILSEMEITPERVRAWLKQLHRHPSRPPGRIARSRQPRDPWITRR